MQLGISYEADDLLISWHGMPARQNAVNSSQFTTAGAGSHSSAEGQGLRVLDLPASA
jgi:hypothetical protein